MIEHNKITGLDYGIATVDTGNQQLLPGSANAVIIQNNKIIQTKYAVDLQMAVLIQMNEFSQNEIAVNAQMQASTG